MAKPQRAERVRTSNEVRKDPICGMEVDPKSAKAKGCFAVKDDKEYYFCSTHCSASFMQKAIKFESMKVPESSLSYTCPMHPNVHSSKPGLCPECGMQLIPEKRKEVKEYDKHAGHNVNIFKTKFWISLILTIPVVLYSELFRRLTGFVPPSFPFSQYIPLALGSIIFFYGGWIFLVGAYRELRARLPGMMTLIGLAITTAYVYSAYVVIAGIEGELFFELTTLITVMLLGHWMEMKAVTGSQKALKELAKLLPDTAEVVRGKETVVVPLADLRVGDIVMIRPGSKIPADGIVVEGSSDVNESAITGESRPVAKKLKSEVIAGTINGDGSLKIKVTKIGENTFLAGVMRLVQEAMASKSKIQLLSDKAAFWLTIVAVAVGGITFALWSLLGDFSTALERAVAVLVIACPHALGLAIPLVASISTTLSARNGLLVRQRLALEASRNVDIVLFDKTGTLTKGEYGVTKILSLKGDPDRILQMAASVDSKSEHFVAKAIVAANKGKLLPVKDFVRLPGIGVQGKVGKNTIVVGGESALTGAVPSSLRSQIDALSKQGQTIIYVLIDKKLIGVISLADIIREESREAVTALRSLGIKSAMVTGDSSDVASWVSSELGIDEYFARVMPDKKAEKVKELQARGLRVMFVGDGINDAPALVQSDVGIAIGAGTNVAIESAGIILVRNDPRDIVKVINLSKKTYSKMIQNLWWASGYNIIAIPLAAGVLAFQGITLQPAVAALLMSLSTVIVAVNAMGLRKVRL